MFLLGRLDGGLRHCAGGAQRILAGKLVFRVLVAALRREGHAFTDARFHAWFAGLATLSDEARLARAPRAICRAILTELAHSSWPVMAERAAQLAPALLAPNDLHREADHEEAGAIVADARSIVARRPVRPDASPLSLLGDLHREAARSIRFAPPEKLAAAPARDRPVRAGPVALPSPCWALDLVWGEWLRRQGALPFALPLPGTVRLDALSDTAHDQTARAAALAQVAAETAAALRDAAGLGARIDALVAGRSTSRAPALFELLAGFGPMRSSQLETALGASRIGVRGMLSTLDGAGLLERSKVAGVILFSVKSPSGDDLSEPGPVHPAAFSDAAMDEYEASLAAIDRLLNPDGQAPD